MNTEVALALIGVVLASHLFRTAQLDRRALIVRHNALGLLAVNETLRRAAIKGITFLGVIAVDWGQRPTLSFDVEAMLICAIVLLTINDLLSRQSARDAALIRRESADEHRG